MKLTPGTACDSKEMPNSDFALKTPDWLVFLSYFAVVSLVAYLFGRKQKTAVAEYFMAGNALPWYVVAGSMVIMTLSTEQIIGNNGAAYQYGFCIAQWDCWTLPWVTMLVWIFLPIYLRKRVRKQFRISWPSDMVRSCEISSQSSASSALPFLNMAVILYTGVILLSNLFPVKLVLAGRDYTPMLWTRCLWLPP